MRDFARDLEVEHEPEAHEGLNAEELVQVAVAEAKRHVRRNELRTNSALDAISNWIEKSELRRTDETKRLASSQERVASAVRDALSLMTERLNQIESIVAETPAKAFEPIRNALGRLDDRVSFMEAQQTQGERNSQHFSALMDSLGKRLTEVVGKIDELAENRSRGDDFVHEERIASIEAKLGSILQQLSVPLRANESAAHVVRPPQAPNPVRPRVILRSVSSSGKLDDAVVDIRRKQEELGSAPGREMPSRASFETSPGIAGLNAELGALAVQLQRLEQGRIAPGAFNALLDTTTELRRLLADPAMPRLAARLEQSLAELTRRVDGLTTKMVDRDEIAELTHAVAEIRTKLAEARPDPTIFERRFEALSAKIDDVMREPLGLVGQHLADLSQRLRSSSDAHPSSEVMSDIRDKLDRIVARSSAPAGQVVQAFDGEALEEVRERLDRLSAKLDQTPTGADPGSIADLRERLEHLAASVEQSTTEAPARIDRVLRQIAASIDAARVPQLDPGRLQALERQMAELSQRIAGGAGSATAIGELERGVMRLADELATTKAAALKAAEAASSGAASQAMSLSPAMHEESAAREREMHGALDHMNATLERIMQRLGSLEEQTRPRPAAQAAAPAMQARAPAADSSQAPNSAPAYATPATRGAAVAVDDDIAQGRAPQRAPELPPRRPAAGHEPLEPGSGRPAQMAAGELGGQTRPHLPGDSSADAANGSPMSAQALIAAARRAAADTATRQKSGGSAAAPLGSPKAALSSLKKSAGARRTPILIALIALIIAFGAIGAGRLFLGLERSSFEGGAPAVPQPAPAPQRPAGTEPGMGSSSGSATAPASPADRQPRAPAAAPSANGRSSSLSAPPSPASSGTSQAASASSSATDLSQPANDVTGSISSQPRANTVASAAPAPDPANSAELVARLRLAANAGDPAAEYELAARMYDGRGMPRDAEGAAKLFERAANDGLAPAQYRLANVYETGIGAPKDLARAKEWFEKAADRGNAKAMHNVGVYLAQGVQGKPDYATAASWFRKAAERDVRDSQYNLAILLARGLGADRDFKASYVWFALAARGGDGDSAKKRDEIAAHLSSAELNDAKAMVASWKPIPLDRAANEVDLSSIKWDRAPAAGAQADQAKTSKL